MRGGMHYLELRKLLLLSYCQAITFYLLLKSEGLSARDHPVIAQLVQMKTLMDKMNELDRKIPANFEDIMNKSIGAEDPMKLVEENVMSDVSAAGGLRPPVISSGTSDLTEPIEVIKKAYMDSSRGHKESVPNGQHQDTIVGIQSREMLKVRAANEERLNKIGVFSSLAKRDNKLKRSRQLINGQLETMDDFDDDALGVDASERSINISRLVNPQMKKHKMASGDDDLPKRDDIGERRRKNELRVLAGTGINSADDVQDEIDDASDHSLGGDSDLDLKVYKQVERERAAKIAAKSGIYARFIF
ncbi:hypothetical protein Leryth_023852 [Lithospermum erythrorhizon]|nr:hypothetical protein Leryth_023852 [Lithospermum erythrorhizon]